MDTGGIIGSPRSLSLSLSLSWGSRPMLLQCRPLRGLEENRIFTLSLCNAARFAGFERDIPTSRRSAGLASAAAGWAPPRGSAASPAEPRSPATLLAFT